MSMIMRVARGNARDLERLATAGDDYGSMPAEFEALLSRQRATLGNLTRRIEAPQMASLNIYCVGDGSIAAATQLADDVKRYFPLLQAHFQAAAQAGQSTLVSLS